MASSQPVQNRIQKVLDPTKIATWNIVRRPPIPNHTVIQGKPREQNSNAFKEFQKQEGARLRKALNRITHGKNIFVYNNIRTNQVVYSLTRYLEKNNVLSQMVFHGKKTVPATLRKDMWVPFYSVHFNDSKVGLRAYHLLREFSMQRQLSPPREMITITQEFLDRKRPRDPVEAEKFDEEYKDKIGRLMDKKQRARVLMDQKATSVADIAAVLKIQEEEIKNGFADGKRGYLTRTARKRRREGRRKEAEASQRAAERVDEFEDLISTDQVEYKIEDPSGNDEYDVQGDEVKILWADLYDAQYAESWPERVRHGELELTRDHVMPGQRRLGADVLTVDAFAEKQPASS
ncbi:hypothetical protein VTN77DRAFT_5177 [Rasamsonia byssochlamydoides]|uniref:mitochondrial 54S ribosomal protein mL67 n=1 Tax=Rasamsonia byssochlamydoides TaxID=89139 RepID=UPI003743DB17